MHAIGGESKKRERWASEEASESEGERVEVKKEVWERKRDS